MQLHAHVHESRRAPIPAVTPKRRTPAEFEEGSAVGRFQIGEELGRGGFATVYKAFDPWLERHVAIKISAKRQATPRRKTTWSEARALACVNHPHVVTLLDVVEEHDREVLVMELVDGASLSDCMIP